MVFVARAIAWAAAAAGLLAGGLLAVGWVLIAITGPGYAKLGDMQQIAFQSLYSAILLQALLPQAGSAFVGWLGVTALVPALGFPIAARRFAIWQPTSTQDVVSTFLLLSGSVALALLLPRLLPKLGPGVFWAKIPSDS